METTIRTDLLKKLADHLLNGILGHKVWDFSTFNISKDWGPYDPNKKLNVCGTNGCAAGECPILWPEEFEFSWQSLESKTTGKRDFPALADFFHISIEQADHLFCPSGRKWDNRNDCESEDEWDEDEVYQVPQLYGGKLLDKTATKQEVVDNIIIFCNKVEAGEIE